VCFREDDVANELESLSLEANKGKKEEPEEETVAPVKKKEKACFLYLVPLFHYQKYRNPGKLACDNLDQCLN
jgi:hypothetical protein